MFLPECAASSSSQPVNFPSSSAEGERESERRVRFDSHASLVLIPSREEFHSENCDLWWQGMDFFCFQRKAVTEIRLLALLQGISPEEAKRRLYQPGPEHSHCWDFVATESAQNTPEPPSQRKSLNNSSSASTRKERSSSGADNARKKSEQLRHLDIEADASLSPARSQSHSHTHSQSHTQSQSHSLPRSLSDNLARSFAEPLEMCPPSLWPAPSESEQEEARAQEEAREREKIAHLHFCVPLTERVPVVERECRPRKHKKKKRDSDGSSSLASTLLALTLFSFLCAVGYHIAQIHTTQRGLSGEV